jgi:lysophospholipase L1-like esterase
MSEISDDCLSKSTALSLKPWLMKSLLLFFGMLAGIIVTAAIAEIWLRHDHKLDLQRYSVQYDLGPDGTSRFQPAKDVLLGWEHSNCTPSDPFGNNDAHYPVIKKRGVYRILVIGDSITETGQYVRYLAASLNHVPSKTIYEVWNCGVGGYNLREYYYNLKYKGFNLEPDMILIGFCLNDVEDWNVVINRDKDGRLQYYIPFLDTMNLDINRTLFFHSYAYRFVALLKSGAMRKTAGGNKSMDAFNAIVSETKKRDIKLLAVIIPYFKSEYTPPDAREYDTMKKMIVNAKINFIDLHDAFHNRDDTSWRRSPDDYIHPSEKGNKVIADKIYDYLLCNPAVLTSKTENNKLEIARYVSAREKS